MQTQHVSAARWAAVLSLQNSLRRLRPNCFEFEVADHAIDLVLNSGRPETPYLLQNAIKDSRSVLIRQRRRTRRRGMVPLFAQHPEQPGIEVSAAVERDPCVGEARPQSVEEQLGWRQEFQAVHTAVSNDNCRAGSVLDGWLVGEDVAETAERLDISTHYVKKLRGTIRHRALDLSDVWRAA